MKGVTAEQMLRSVEKFESLSRMVKRLDGSGLFADLSLTLTAILVSEQNSGQVGAEDLKDCLKLLTSQLIDDISKNWEGSKPSSAATTARTQTSDHIYAIDYSLLDSRDVSKPSKPRAKPSYDNSSTHSTRTGSQSLQCSPRSFHQKSASMSQFPPPALRSVHCSPARINEELKSVSDFAFPVPSVLFNRSPRRTLEVRDLSPGPAYYRPNVDNVKDKRTSALIQKSGKRYEYLVPDSPGPAYYTPLRTFLAKRLTKH